MKRRSAPIESTWASLCVAAAAAVAASTGVGCSAGDCPRVAGEFTVVQHCDPEAVGAVVTITPILDYDDVETCSVRIDIDNEPDVEAHVWHDGTVSLYGRFEGAGTMGCTGTATSSQVTLRCGSDADCAVQLVAGGGTVNPPPPTPNCPDIGGAWTYTQLCAPEDTYFEPGETTTFYQTGCGFSVVDASGFNWTGTVTSANGISMQTDFLGSTLTCSGTVSATRIAMDCDPNLCGGPPSRFIVSR